MKQFQWKISYPLSIQSNKNIFDQIPNEYKEIMNGSGRESYEFFYELVLESNETQWINVTSIFLRKIPSFSRFQKRMRRSYSEDIISEPFNYQLVYNMLNFLVQSGETWLFSYTFE